MDHKTTVPNRVVPGFYENGNNYYDIYSIIEYNQESLVILQENGRWGIVPVEVASQFELIRACPPDWETALEELDDTHILWSMGSWDGPAAGIATHEGQFFYFDTPNKERRLRFSILYPISDEEFLLEKKIKQKFKNTTQTISQQYVRVAEYCKRIPAGYFSH